EQLEALHKGHDSARAMLRLVVAMTGAGDEKRAFEAAERALVLAPSSEEILRVHARLALDIGTAHRAARSVEALARMRPDVAEYQVFLGETWSLRQKMGDASEAYLRALALDPDLVVARKPLGLALNHESRFAEGREHLERFLAEHPEDLDALAGLAEAEERLGEPEAAAARARKVLDVEPTHARANLVLGMVRSGRGEFEQARRILEQAVEVDPWLAKAHYQLSFACARVGDRDCARRHLQLYERALEGPESTFVQLEAASPEAASPAAETMMMRGEGDS
ncbi:MAG: tetratricopeptide repeat protein, partial [Acidobacteriota bacterium]